MIEKLKQMIQESNNIVFFGGAGVSTESGVPDFRSENGLYQAQRQYGRSPETMLSHSFYMSETETFYDYYKNNLVYRDVKPNRAHEALAKLEELSKLKAVITQNIDGLHQLAGSKNVYELHGSVRKNRCRKCHQFYDLDYIMDVAHCKGLIPICETCGGIIKPEVVLYEEPLDDVTIEGAVRAIAEADMLIVGGTSLVVYPAAGLLQYFNGDKLVLINKSSTQYDSRADLVIHQAIGDVLGACVLD